MNLKTLIRRSSGMTRRTTLTEMNFILSRSLFVYECMISNTRLFLGT